VFLSILFTRASTNIPRELANSGVQIPDGQAFSLDDTSGLAQLPADVRHPILVGFSDAMDTVFLVGALVLVIGVVLSALMKEVPLRMVSGQQARAAARAAEPVADTPAAAAASAAPADVTPLAARAEAARGGTET
jgi:hypothetical protein